MTTRDSRPASSGTAIIGGALGVKRHALAATTLLLLANGVLGCGGEDQAATTTAGSGGAGTAAAVGSGGATATVDSVSAAVGGASATTSTATAAGGSTSTTGTASTTTGAAGSTTTGTPSTTTGSTTSGTGGSGGSGNDSGESSQVDGLPETSCTITVLGSDIAQIQTVGVVTFSTDLAGVSIAEIQFGQDTSYGLIAPVDLAAADYRTLLLGMTENSTFNYRIAVSDGSQVCYSENQTLQTGALDVEGLTEASRGDGAANGFIVTSRGNDAIIFNEDGDLVWGYGFDGRVFSAGMSWDGQYMFARDTGPFDAGSGGTFYRVGIDGSGATTLDAPGGDHHDFAPIPGGIAYLGKTAAGECDQVFTASNELTDGSPLFDTWQIFQYFSDGGGGLMGETCHANRIHYLADLDAYTVSDRNKDAIAIFQADGTPITSIGTTPSGGWTQHIQAEGTGSSWQAQHGHHYYADDQLLIFTNEADGGSAMLHYTISGSNATLDWSYAGAGSSMTQGDVQFLPNGNFLVTASNSGTIHELDPMQNLISSYSAGSGGGMGGGMGGGLGGGGFGYVVHRPTLYGPPPAR